MYQGEFIERMMDIDKIVTMQDIHDFVSECPDSKIPSLNRLIETECMWLFKFNSKIKAVEEYRDKQRERVSYLMECIKEREGYANRMLPDFLTERGIKAFYDSIENGLIDKESYSWLKSKAALSNWVADINAVNGVVSKLGMGKTKSWAGFQKYFGIKRLASKSNKSELNKSCPDFDPVKAKIFPEIYDK